MPEGQVFTSAQIVRFADCDPAGIVFYPRYFEMFNRVVEDWCAEALEWSFARMHLEARFGLPTVHVECDFKHPSRLGDMLHATLEVERVGTSSATLALALHDNAGQLRVSASVVVVLMDLQTQQSVPLPEAVRVRMLNYVKVKEKVTL